MRSMPAAPLLLLPHRKSYLLTKASQELTLWARFLAAAGIQTDLVTESCCVAQWHLFIKGESGHDLRRKMTFGDCVILQT